MARPRQISELDRAAVVALACQLPAATGVPLGRWTGPELTADLLAYLAERVARFKLPRTVEYVAELPRDPNGKLYKRRLRDPYWAGRDHAI